jgi:hypothetical protein
MASGPWRWWCATVGGISFDSVGGGIAGFVFFGGQGGHRSGVARFLGLECVNQDWDGIVQA